MPKRTKSGLVVPDGPTIIIPRKVRKVADLMCGAGGTFAGTDQALRERGFVVEALAGHRLGHPPDASFLGRARVVIRHKYLGPVKTAYGTTKMRRSLELTRGGAAPRLLSRAPGTH